MKKLGTLGALLIIITWCLAGCTTTQLSKKALARKNMEYSAIFSDPNIKQDFNTLTKIARNAKLYKKDGNVYIVPEDVAKLNAVSKQLVRRLSYYYHLDPTKNKIHTYIGKMQYNSCYQYYNYWPDLIGKSCQQFPDNFASCHDCNDYIDTLHARTKRTIHATWGKGQNITALVSTFSLRNGAPVYLGIELTAN